MNEIWKDIPGFEGMYQISSLGRVKRLAYTMIRSNNMPMTFKEKLAPIFPCGTQRSKACVQLYKRNVRYDLDIESIMVQVFLGANSSAIVYHIDGDYDNNKLDNLSVIRPEVNSDVEIWKPVIGYEDIYEVSNLGNVRSIERRINHSRLGYNVRRSVIHRSNKDSGDHINIALWRDGKCKQTLVHRLVAQAFIPNPDNKPLVNHKDGNKRNNCVNNLEWVTPKENFDHGVKIGLTKLDGKPRKVKCIELGIIYPSIAAASRATGCSGDAIKRSIYTKSRSRSGFTFVNIMED